MDFIVDKHRSRWARTERWPIKSNIKLGSLVRLKSGVFEWEYRGRTEDGKIILYTPVPFSPSGITILVKEEEVDWESLQLEERLPG